MESTPNRSRNHDLRGRRHRRRRGTILALFVVMAVVLLGMVALTVDVGFIHTTRREAQVAADAAAMAAAAYVPTSTSQATSAAVTYAGYNEIAGSPITSASVEVQFGTWAPSLGVFTPAANPGNAVRVTVRRDATHAGPVPLYFGRILNKTGFDVSRSAIAMTTPRDILFVVDTSGSMKDDGEPCWATTLVNASYPNVGTSVMQQIFTDLGFGAFPGSSQFVGQGLTGITNDGWNYAQMTKNTGPLSTNSNVS
ncbi:MAG: TadG family pilus assembly protein, partial [Planctomycetota bacterium]